MKTKKSKSFSFSKTVPLEYVNRAEIFNSHNVKCWVTFVLRKSQRLSALNSFSFSTQAKKKLFFISV